MFVSFIIIKFSSFYLQVENAGGERLMELSDAVVACGYTGLINVDRKKAIIEYVNTYLLMPLAPLRSIGHWQMSSKFLVASFSRSPQLCPLPDISVWTSLLQLFLGRPIFHFPWGFHFRACRVMLVTGFLTVCPIQLHFLLWICMSKGSCPVLSHRSTFLTLSLHQIFGILLRQSLINVCSLVVCLFLLISMFQICTASPASCWSWRCVILVLVCIGSPDLPEDVKYHPSFVNPALYVCICPSSTVHHIT